MMSNTALYAAKKRKKPVQKMPKPPPPEGAKSNPSKRHRDRLNSELDKLTSLLPFSEEVRSRLDKLSVLRLSVGYLKVKSFFNATMKMGQSNSSYSSERSLMFGGNGQSSALPPCSSTSTTPSSFTTSPSSTATSIDGVTIAEGELLLQALSGFVLVVTAEGYVFYTSPTIQDFLGFHQSDVVHQSVFELIHTDDRAFFRQQLHFSLNPNTEGSSDQNNTEISHNIVSYEPQAIPPENSSFLERNFCCRLRCLLDNSSGFLALNFRGRLKFLHGQSQVSEDGSLVPPQLALFAIATPMQQPSILEIRTKTLIFQTKHKLDFTPTGIDTRAKLILGYSETEICRKGSGYNFIHAADMMYCAENHVRMMKTGHSGLTIFRLLTKSGRWLWVQSNARLVMKNGKPDFIMVQQRALTNEEGEEHLRLRRLQLPFNFATGEALLYDVAPSIDINDQCSAPKQGKFDSDDISPGSLLGCLLNQDHSLYCDQNSVNTLSNLNDLVFEETHATLNVPGDIDPNPAPGNPVKAEATVQDIMETLQQILGDNEIIETLHVEPEELKSWESTLLQMNYNNGFNDDLDDILNNDILSYVEEQLQKDGGLNLPNELDGVTACLPALDLQNQNPDQREELDFGWPLKNPMMVGQPTAVQGTMKLSHMDFPQLSSSGLNGLTFNPSLPNSFPQTKNQLQANTKENELGTFLLRQPSTNQLHPSQMSLHMMPPTQPFTLQDQNTEGQLNNVFTFHGSKCSKSVPHQADSCAETFTSNISNDSVFPAVNLPPSCLQGRFALQTPNGDNQSQVWPQQQQLIVDQQMGSFQRNPTGISALNRPRFRATGASNAPLPVQQVLEPPPASTSCMHRNTTPGLPVNSMHLSQARLTAPTNKIPSNPSCFYQGLNGGRAMSGMAAIPNPDEATLSCQMPTGLKLNSLVGQQQQQQQQFLNFSEQTQINNRPVVGNGGFPFFSLPNGNMCYSENK
ncbi:aryl hydrocarbon receptor 2 [Archocentrus centrarchus]|uniref:aryl hydrocarbon receptor 2 n=1 Tax=Archocentrus centrarchus TaxID=63155 RepID=UPI0011E9CB52|nr:aryl hydrocarbon receptor-like [Archocentrus centrarchus]